MSPAHDDEEPQAVDSHLSGALATRQNQRHIIAAEVLPGGWHYLESIEFCAFNTHTVGNCLAVFFCFWSAKEPLLTFVSVNKVVRPHCIASQIIPTAFNNAKTAETPIANTIISYALAVRISNAPVDSSEAAHLRPHLYRRVKELLDDVNRDISLLPDGNKGLDIILRKINGLKGVEVK